MTLTGLSNGVIALLVGLILGSIFALFVARRSLKEDAVHGGAPAKFFHFLGVLGFCMTLPTVIMALLLRGGFALAFPLGIGCVIVAFLALLIYALFERPARAELDLEDDVWTEEKARTSGL